MKITKITKETALVIIPALIAAIFINNVIITNSVVPTASMENTIAAGDRVIGSRLSYSVFGEPKRGDIVAFKFGVICNKCGEHVEGFDKANCPICDSGLANAEKLHYVKRLIGLPGDHIVISDDTVNGMKITVNGVELYEPYLKEAMLDNENLTFNVPENEYFFLGDNRNNSYDSRYWDYPYIKRNNIESKIIFRYFPSITFF